MEISPGLSFNALIASMIGLSVYFTVDVQMRRTALRGSTASLTIADGDPITVDTPIDGDELSVHHDDQTFTVRLLGVKAFDVSNEPGLGDPGQRAIDTLARHKGKDGEVRFASLAYDRADRLLARVEVDGEDVGEALIAEGWAVTYTKYPFPEMDAYLVRQAEAERQRRGLWSSPKAAERARKLRASWELDE